MKYSIENNGSGVCLIRVSVPSSLAASFLAFIEQKSRENHRNIIKSPSSLNEQYFIDLNKSAVAFFDAALSTGSAVKAALSETNYKLKAAGFANVSYEITKQILQKLGKLKRKSP